jgi:translation initiation factor IF-3
MKGRERQRWEDNKKSLFQFIEMLSDVSTPESFPKDEGDSKTIVILEKNLALN